jgi:zinc protease
MKGVPANELQQGMHFIKAALGVDCTHCHVENAFDKDDNPLKDKARAMYLMMTEFNRANFGGRSVVTCYTCHKGHATPQAMPDLPVPPVAATETKKTPLPAVDELLAKYVAALGGEAAMRKVTSRVITATEDIPTGPGGTVPMPATLRRSMKAPNLNVDEVTTARFTIANGFDGTDAWIKGQNGNVNTMAAAGIDAERIKRAAALDEPLTIKQQYSAMLVEGTAQVNGHDAYVVMGISAAKTPERLYFDTGSGLLLRKWNYLETAAGPSPFQMDFDDYRDTGSGVKIPFVIKMSPATTRSELSTGSTMRVTSVKDNVPLDAAIFVKPQQLTRPAP